MIEQCCGRYNPLKLYKDTCAFCGAQTITEAVAAGNQGTQVHNDDKHTD